VLRNTCLLSLVVLTFSAVCPGETDPVESLLVKGLAAHKAGKVQDAIAALQEAVLLLQKSQEKGLAKFLPKAPAGWKGGEVESSSGAVGTGEGGATFTTLTQTFTRIEDEVTAAATLSTSNQLIEAHKAMAESYSNPQVLAMMNQDPDVQVKLISQDGWAGWIMVRKGDSAQAMAMSSGCMVSVQLDKPDEAALTALWNTIDLKGLARATAPQTPSKPAADAAVAKPADQEQ